MLRRICFTALLAGLFLVSNCLTAAGQVTGGTISGTVTDPQHAYVPSAQVVVASVDKGEQFLATTNGQGFYTVPDLVPGTYTITITAAGFSSFEEKDVLVQVGGQVVANIDLKVGSVSETVEVQSGAVGIELASSMLSNIVDGKTVRDLPLNGRDWTQLATLEPGVDTVNTEKQIQTGANARVNTGFGLQMSISGARPQQTNYRLDGVSLNDYASNGPGNVLGGSSGVDSVQEFSVITSNAPSEYGKTSGGVVNAVTRSGTNSFHGSAYDFIRNSALDSRNYFDIGSVPPFKRNQFGATLGGPVVKGHTFLFGNYEGTRQSLSTTTSNTVPSAAAHSGHLVAGTVAIDPKVVPFLALFPLPNVSTAGDTGVYSFVGKAITSQDFFTVRGDQTFSSKDNGFAVYQRDVSQTTGPDSFGFSTSALNARRHVATIGENYSFNPNLINSLRIGFNRVIGDGPVPVAALDPRAADTTLGFVPNQPVGNLTITGISTFTGGVGSQGNSIFHFNSYQIADDLFQTIGLHSIKVGVALEQDQTNEVQTNQPIGSYTFGSLGGFLTNVATQFSTAIPGFQPEIGLRQNIVGAYGQDDWRIRSNLTLNFGIRYETASVPTEQHNRLSTLANLTDAQVKTGSPWYDNATRMNFEPRVGFAWDPYKTGKTSVRGAFGIYDTLPLAYMTTGFVTAVAPYAQLGSITNPPKGTFPNGGLALLTPANARVAYIQQHPGRSYTYQYSLSLQQEFPGSIILQLGYTGSHGIRQPFRSNDADIVLPTVTPLGGYLWPSPRASGTKLNPNVGRIEALAWITPTYYDAANVRVTKQMSKGVQFGASYTWSKIIDTGSGSIAGGAFDNSIVGLTLTLPQLVRGLSDYDVPQIFVANGMWDVPTPWAKGDTKVIAAGWQIGGIFRATSGQPFTPVIGGDPLGMNNSSPFDYPNRVRGNGCVHPVNPGNPLHYIRTECFALPASPTLLGNSGRNIAFGPGVTALDASVIKSTAIPRFSDAFRVQFRAEAFNITNHSNYQAPTPPATQLYNQALTPLAGAGVLFRTSTTSRQLQFGLKVTF